MSFEKIGDFESQFQTPNYVRWENIQGGVITAQEFVLAGGTTGVIRSQDYAPGSAGWAIFGDGSAEFAGDVDFGGNVTLVGSGAFRTAASGERLEILESGTGDISWYNASNGLVATLGVDTATGYIDLNAGSDWINLIAEGLDISVPTSGVDLDGFLKASQGLRSSDGTVSLPSFSFFNDLNTGMFRAASDDGRLVAGGSSIAQFTTGRFGPGSDNSISLGGSGLRWTEVFAVNGTINTSDARYKKNIRDLDYGLDFINQLRPVKFRWRKSKDKSLHWGLLAQELAEHTTSGPYREGEILGINYAELVPALIKAVQELSAEVEALRKGG